MEASPLLMDDNASQPVELANDTPCRTCGYNLRGLKTTDNCPECGTSAQFSLQSDQLRFANPLWLEKMARGLLIIVCTSIATLFISIASILFDDTATGKIISLGVNLAIGLLAAMGIWWLTEPDPSGLGENRYFRARKVIRYCVLFSLLVTPLNLYAELATYSRTMSIFIIVMLTLSTLVGVVSVIALIMYLERMAQRIPDPRLAKRGRVIRWGLTVTQPWIVLYGGYVTLFGVGRIAASKSILEQFFTFLNIASGMIIFVLTIALFFLLARFRTSFLREATDRRTTTAAGTKAISNTPV